MKDIIFLIASQKNAKSKKRRADAVPRRRLAPRPPPARRRGRRSRRRSRGRSRGRWGRERLGQRNRDLTWEMDGVKRSVSSKKSRMLYLIWEFQWWRLEYMKYCHYLKFNQWRLAISYLEDADSMIESNAWGRESNCKWPISFLYKVKPHVPLDPWITGFEEN